MKDTASGFFKQFLSALNSYQSEKVVAVDSKAIGTSNQIIPIAQRLSSTREGAMARKHLEDTQLGQETPEGDTLEEEMIQTLADDIIHKALEKMFGE